MEGYFRLDMERDREKKDVRNYNHLLLLAKNREGFKNLMRLSSESFEDSNFYQKPCLSWQLLRKYSEGLIASSSCLSGLLPRMLVRGDTEAVERYLRVFQDIFHDDFYLEIQPHDIEEQKLVNIEMCNLSASYGIPLVAAIDAHYPHKEWSDTQDVLVMIATNQSKSKREKDEQEGKGYMAFTKDSFYLMDGQELSETFHSNHNSVPVDLVSEAITNTVVFADRCEHIQVSKAPKIPKASKSSLESERILRDWIKEGLKRVGKTQNQVYLDRVEEEFAVIKKLGVLDYFLIVGDAVRWAKSQGIRVGPGRGSGAGCLINYLIRITAIDPIGYGLLFERFLNEYRTELPDIDIDFQDNRRDEVKEYLVNKWGKEHVVGIASYQSFGFKGVIQDVSRVLNLPFDKARRATNAIPDKTWGETLESLEITVPQIKQFFAEFPEAKEHALRLHGQMRGQSKHAAAVIITDKPAVDLIPMMRAKDGLMVTQWTERANAQLISPYGFLKIDLLSTNGLTFQDIACKFSKKRIDFENIKQFPVMESPEFADPRVVEAFGDGMNLGVFQFASAGMKGLLKDIKPTSLSHLIAANALFRPGTIGNGMSREYAYRKNGKKWTLLAPELEPFLNETYGILCYQESVVSIFRALAKDCSPGEAALFLKVVSKGISRDLKGKEKLQPYYEKFKEGCTEKGIDLITIDDIWSQFIDLTEYAFNKSHSAGYALQGYQDKWLKMHIAQEAYASLLTVETSQVPQIIREMKMLGLNVLPPDVNKSDVGFTIDGKNIRYGLRAIKGLGDVAIREIVDNRPYKSFEDFTGKVPKKKVNKTRKFALLESGAFDCWGGRSKWLLDDEASARVQGTWTEEEQIEKEIERLNISLSRIPDLERYRTILEERIIETEELVEMENQEVMIGGEVISVKEHKTKNRDIMAFVHLAFGEEEYDLTLWPEKYQAFYPILREGNIVLAIGDWQKDRQSTIVKNMCTAAQLEQ